jgi:hypothetical protein
MATVQLIAQPPFSVDYHAIQAEQTAHPKELSERIWKVASNALFLLGYVFCSSAIMALTFSCIICIGAFLFTTAALSPLFLTAFLIVFTVFFILQFIQSVEAVYPGRFN